MDNALSLLNISERSEEVNQVLRTFLINTPSPTALLDNDMRYVAASDSWVADYKLDLTLNELIGKSHYEVFPEIGDVWKGHHKRVLGGEVIKRDYDEFERTDGTIQYLRYELRPWFLKDKIAGMLMLTEDISDSVVRQLKLEVANNEARQAEKKLISYLENLGTAVMVAKGKRQQISFSNRHVEEVFGPGVSDAKTLVQLFDMILVTKSEATRVKRTIKNFMSSDMKSCTTHVKANSVSQEVIYVKLHGAKNEDNLLITFDDITSEVNILNSLSKLNFTLTQQNEKVEEFAQITSHNLRSSISNINALVHVLTNDYEKDLQDEALERLAKTSESLGKTVAELGKVFNVRKNYGEKPVKVQFDHALEDAKHHISETIRVKNVKITSDFSIVNHTTYNPAYFKSIVLNLLSNAVKYSADDRVSEIHFSTTTESGRVVLFCKDNGIGIDLKNYGHKIFQLHQTFHEGYDSQGIGLFMTKKQLESSGGRIEVESTVNVGTTFKISF